MRLIAVNETATDRNDGNCTGNVKTRARAFHGTKEGTRSVGIIASAASWILPGRLFLSHFRRVNYSFLARRLRSSSAPLCTLLPFPHSPPPPATTRGLHRGCDSFVAAPVAGFPSLCATRVAMAKRLDEARTTLATFARNFLHFCAPEPAPPAL